MVEVAAQRGEPIGIHLVDATGPDRTRDDEPGVLQHLEVLRDRGATDRQLAGELADRSRAIGEELEDRLPGRIAESRPAGLVAGAFSMAMGEYTSVRTQNEQVDREWAKESAEIRENSVGEERELAAMFKTMGMTRATAAAAASGPRR